MATSYRQCVYKSAHARTASEPTVDNKVAVLILQHPQEQDHVLGTAGLLCRHAGPCPALGRPVVAQSRPCAGRAGRGARTGACSISARRMPPGKGPLVALDRKGEPLADQDGARAPACRGIVVLDGNWAQAKALWWRNAWLTRLRRFVVVPDGPVALRQPAQGGPARRGLDPRGRGARAVGAREAMPALREKLLAPFRELIAKARSRGRPGRQTGSSEAPLAPIIAPCWTSRRFPSPNAPTRSAPSPRRCARSAGRGRDLPRRGHPRRHQGHPAVGRGLCRRLPGRAGLASGRRAGRIAGPARRAGRPSRDLHQRGLGGGAAGRLDQLSDPRLRHLEIDRRHQRGGRCAQQSRLARRDRRRADRGRRGLRRGRLGHPGTRPCLCAEILGLADGPAAVAADHRALHREGVRAFRGDQHAGDDGAAHPRLPRHRRVRRQGQQAAGDLAQPSSRRAGARTTTTASRIRRRPTRTRRSRSRCASPPPSASSSSMA